jgi:XTP/dITP diphosphohydrolase
MFSNRIAMSDDSGIEILAYNNGPGVRSARFLPELTYEQKNKKIIADLEETSGHQRAAKYKCAIAIYTPGGKSFLCEGECDGVISTDLKGDGGFGYDPIFFLPEYGKTFAELPAKIKNQISHRAKAFKKAKKILSGLKNANTTK